MIEGVETDILKAYSSLSPSAILAYFATHRGALEPHYKPTGIDSDGQIMFKNEPWTFIILGRGGPTGKTWLCDCLRRYGFVAIELSESMYPFVTYKDARNHIVKDCVNHIVIVVLNMGLENFRS